MAAAVIVAGYPESGACWFTVQHSCARRKLNALARARSCKGPHEGKQPPTVLTLTRRCCAECTLPLAIRLQALPLYPRETPRSRRLYVISECPLSPQG